MLKEYAVALVLSKLLPTSKKALNRLLKQIKK